MKKSIIWIGFFILFVILGIDAFAAPTKQELELEVKDLKIELENILSEIDSLQDEIENKEKEIIQKEEDIASLEQEQKIAYSQMKLRIKYSYENGDNFLLDSVLKSDGLAAAINKAQYVEDITSYDQEQIEKIIQLQEEIEQAKDELISEKEELNNKTSDLENKKDELNTLIASKEEEIKSIDEELLLRTQQACVLAPVEYTSSDVYVEPIIIDGGTVVGAAYSQLGVPYVWGGSSPGVALDCSGLVQYCYACAGISIPRTSYEIEACGTIVSDPQPGDICWTPGHVAIYIGGGQMIEAQQSGVPVCISPVRASKYLRF